MHYSVPNSADTLIYKFTSKMHQFYTSPYCRKFFSICFTLTWIICLFNISVPAKLLEAYIDGRRSIEEHVRVGILSELPSFGCSKYFLSWYDWIQVNRSWLLSVAGYCFHLTWSHLISYWGSVVHQTILFYFRDLLNHRQISFSLTCIPWSRVHLH